VTTPNDQNFRGPLSHMTFVHLVINPILCVLNANSFCILEAKKYLWRVPKKLDSVNAASLPANPSV
jgi:fumarate reductase subunit C